MARTGEGERRDDSYRRALASKGAAAATASGDDTASMAIHRRVRERFEE